SVSTSSRPSRGRRKLTPRARAGSPGRAARRSAPKAPTPACGPPCLACFRAGTTAAEREGRMAIKKGDRLIMSDQGRERPVKAVGDEHDGNVDVEDEKGSTFTMSVYQLRPADDD